MQIIHDYKNCPDDVRNSVIALGNFDGIHKGHQAIIAETNKIAQQTSKPSAVMTFEPHPVSIFKPDTNHFRLTSLEKKAQLLADIGVDYMFVMQFSPEFAKITAQNFIEEILVGSLDVSHIVIGYDFIFGHEKGGNAQLLHEYASKCNYGFTQVEAVGGDEIYSSTQIRKSLREGNLTKATAMLGRNYSVAGKVVHGDNRGKSIGFPTINVDSGNLLRPACGVYAVKILIENDNKTYNGVANIGTKPTFDGIKEELEVHIFDFSKDIYGANVEIIFVEYIRGEKKFDNVDALVAQIGSDCEIAKKGLRL